MKEHSTMSPASVMSRATSPTRRMFSTRSAVGEAEILVEAVADVVAVEHQRVDAARVQLRLDEIGDGRFAGAGEAGEPQDRRALMLERGARSRLVTLRSCRWTLVARRRPWVDHARRRRLVGGAVDQDEGAGLAIVGIGIEGDRLRRREVAERRPRSAPASSPASFSSVLTSIRCLQLGDGRRHRRGADLQQIGAARQQRLLAHPDDMRGELVGDFGPRVAACGSTSPRAMSISSASVTVTASPAPRLATIAVRA